MLAARWHARGDVRVEEVPDPPSPAPGLVVVEVILCGVCGSDQREYLAGPVLIPTAPHPLTRRAAPITLGHEIVGRVVEVGHARDDEWLGRRVVIDPTLSCGRCPACRRGDTNLCSTAGCLGVSQDGGLAQFLVASTDKLTAVPDSLPDEAAALAEPLAVALHAVHLSGIQLGEKVVVSGFGPIGAGATLASLAAGASHVVVLEPSARRRAQAAALGVSVVDPTDRAAMVDLRGMSDIGIECSGADGTLTSVLRSCRPGGRVVVPGVAHSSAQLNLKALTLTEQSITGAAGYRGEIAQAVGLLSARLIDPAVFATTTRSLLSLPDWFASGDEDETLKVLVSPIPS